MRPHISEEVAKRRILLSELEAREHEAEGDPTIAALTRSMLRKHVLRGGYALEDYTNLVLSVEADITMMEQELNTGISQ